MSLDQVIKKDWSSPGAKKAPSKAGGKSGGKGSAGRGKARGRGLGIRRNPALEKARRVPAAGGKGKGAGRMRWVPKGSVPPPPTRASKSQGRGWGSKGGGKGKSEGRKGGQKGQKGRKGQVQRLWRGAGAARAPPTNAERRAGKGAGKGAGKTGGKQLARAQWDPRRVNRANVIAKRSQKGKGKVSSWKGGGKALAISNGAGRSYSKGKGGKKGQGYGGGGSWGQERGDARDSWSSFESPRGGGKGRGDDRRASEELTAEDRRMMKKITIVAQLDKVPRPHPAMQGLVRGSGKRSGGGDTGSLGSRFAANFSR